MRDVYQQLININKETIKRLISYQDRMQEQISRLENGDYNVAESHKREILTTELLELYKKIKITTIVWLEDPSYSTLGIKLQEFFQEDIGDPNILIELRKKIVIRNLHNMLQETRRTTTKH